MAKAREGKVAIPTLTSFLRQGSNRQHYIVRIQLNPSKDFGSYPVIKINSDLLTIFKNSQQHITITIEFVVLDWDIRWSPLLAKYVRYYRKKLRKRAVNIKAIYVKFYFIKSARKFLGCLPNLNAAKQIYFNSLVQPSCLNNPYTTVLAQNNASTAFNTVNNNLIKNNCLPNSLMPSQEFFKGLPILLINKSLSESFIYRFQQLNAKKFQLKLRKKIALAASKITKQIINVTEANNNFVMNFTKPELVVGAGSMVVSNNSRIEQAAPTNKQNLNSTKGGTYTHQFGLFKKFNKSKRSVINLVKTAKTDNVIRLSHELKQAIPKSVKPKSRRAAIAEALAKAAIEGAINGLDAIESEHVFDAFAAIEGLYYEAAFNKTEYADLLKIISKLLLATRQPLENFSKLHEECLIRHLATQLQTNMLLFKDATTCAVEIVINYQIKLPDKIKLFKEAIHAGINAAEQRMAIAPSAPSYAECESANLAAEPNTITDIFNNIAIVPSAPPLEECESEENELALLNAEHAPSAPALEDVIDQIPIDLAFTPSYPAAYTIIDTQVARVDLIPSAPSLYELTGKIPKRPEFNPKYPIVTE